MATQRQIHANRLNSARSTGPKSEAGKRASSRNALRHGLLAKVKSLSDDDRTEYQLLLDTLLEDLAPSTALEERLLEEVATGFWRSRRVLQAEAEIFPFLEADRIVERLRTEYARQRDELTDPLAGLRNSAHLKGLHDEATEAARRRDAVAPLAVALLSGDGMFSKIHRYATTTHRALYRALDQFLLVRKLQLSPVDDDGPALKENAGAETGEELEPVAESAASVLPCLGRDATEPPVVPRAVGLDDQPSAAPESQLGSALENPTAIQSGHAESAPQDRGSPGEPTLAPSQDMDCQTKPIAE